MLADLPLTNPSACGIGLSSHIVLWNTLLRLALADAKAQRPLSIERLFERALGARNPVGLEEGLDLGAMSRVQPLAGGGHHAAGEQGWEPPRERPPAALDERPGRLARGTVCQQPYEQGRQLLARHAIASLAEPQGLVDRLRR